MMAGAPAAPDPEALPDPATLPEIDAAVLAAARRAPSLPVRLRFGSDTLVLETALRILPGRRSVFRARLGTRRVLARVFVGRAALRRAARAQAGQQRLVDAGLPTPELVGAELLAGGGLALLSDWITDALDGTTAARTAPGATLAAVGELVGRGHRAGLRQSDPHLDNFLIRGSEAWFVDGDAVVVAPTPRGAALVDEFARLLAQVPAAVAPPTVALLAGWSLGAGTEPGVDLDRLLRRVRFRRQLRMQHYLAKARRNCSEFSQRQRGALLLRVLRMERSDELDRALRDPEALHAAGEPVVGGRRVRCAQRTLLAHRFVPRFGVAFGAGPGERAWLALTRARLLELAAPRPLALVERRLGPLVGTGWLFADEAVPAAATTDAAVLDVLRSACARFRAVDVAPDAIDFCPLWIERGGHLLRVPLHALPAWLPPGRADQWPEQAARLDAALLALVQHAA